MNLELHPEAFGNNPLPTFTWENGAVEKSVKAEKTDRSLRVEVPIISNGKSYATLSLKKSLKHGNYDRFVLRRVEHLRRTITGAMEKLAIRSLICPEVLDDRRRPDKHTAKEWKGHERRSLSNFL